MTTFAGTVLAVVVFGTLAAFAVIYALSHKEGRGSVPSRVNRAADCIHYGATLINDGYEFYPDWCSVMLREFDDSIEPRLREFYDAAKFVADRPREQWPAAIAKQLGNDFQ